MQFTAEVFDQVQRLFDVNGFNDHQLHCVLRFDPDAAPDATILSKAVIASIEAIPILGARYIDGAKPHWESLDRADFARAFTVAQTEADLEAVLVAPSDEGRGPQVKVCLLDARPAAIAVTLNHMVCDAAGFKSYLYTLSAIYTELTADRVYAPRAVTGERSIRSVLEHFGFGTKLKSLFLQSEDNNQTGDRRFPLSEGETDRPFIVTRRLAGERTAPVKAYSRACGATLNDLALTAFYRSLFLYLDLRPGERLAIPVMVDMRRYLENRGEFTALTNLTSMVATQLDYRPEEPFAGTLRRVKAEMDAKKGADIGLNAFVKLDLLFRICGDRIANARLRTRLKNPLICMTNVGSLDEARLAFAGLRPSEAYLCGSIKYKPYFQLALSTYRDELTFSINQYGSGGDRERIHAFLRDVEAQLPIVASSATASATAPA